MRKTFKVICSEVPSEKDYDDFDCLGLSLENKDDTFIVVGLAEDFDYLVFTKNDDLSISPFMRKIIDSWKASDYEVN